MIDTSMGKPQLRPGCRLAPGEDVLLIPEGALRLQGPAARIVRACDGNRTLAEVIDELMANFPSADRALISRETTSFLTQLAERGVLEFV